jgi:D-alanine transaminase
MPEIAYVNGEYCDIADAKVSVEDRGFQFADGVYEVIVAMDGRPFRLEPHLERLKRSAEGIALEIDFERLNLCGMIDEGIRRSGFKDVMIYLQVTRGVASRDHVHPDGLEPTVVATFKPKPVYDPALRARGVALQTVADIRWQMCWVKSIALLPNVVLKNAARRAGFHDAIIVGADGNVRETTCTNVFMVKEGVLHTPPATDRILHGITRGFIVECAQSIDIPCKEADMTVPDLLAADEVFISSTTVDVMPVTSIDGKTIGTGRPGPIVGRLLDCFREAMSRG